MSKNEKIFGLMLVLIVGLAVVFAITSYDKPVKPSKPDRYEYQVLNYESIDPATLKFSIELTNPTEITWVKPSCTVTFESPTGQYRGWDIFTIEEPINGKSSRTFTGDITVSNDGSAHVTKHTVECE